MKNEEKEENILGYLGELKTALELLPDEDKRKLLEEREKEKEKENIQVTEIKLKLQVLEGFLYDNLCQKCFKRFQESKHRLLKFK